MSDQSKWVGVNDNDVKIAFRCEEDNCPDPGEVEIGPEALVEGGIPHCEACDEEMTYSHIKIRRRS